MSANDMSKEPAPPADYPQPGTHGPPQYTELCLQPLSESYLQSLMVQFQGQTSGVQASKSYLIEKVNCAVQDPTTSLTQPFHDSHPLLPTCSMEKPQSVQGMVVQDQPHTAVMNRTDAANKSLLAFSVQCLVLSILCSWPALLCSIPALICSVMSMKNYIRGDHQSGERQSWWSLWLGIAALITTIVTAIVAVAIYLAER